MAGTDDGATVEQLARETIVWLDARKVARDGESKYVLPRAHLHGFRGFANAIWFAFHFGERREQFSPNIRDGFRALLEALRWHDNDARWVESAAVNLDKLAGPPQHPVPDDLTYDPARFAAVMVALKLMAGEPEQTGEAPPECTLPTAQRGEVIQLFRGERLRAIKEADDLEADARKSSQPELAVFCGHVAKAWDAAVGFARLSRATETPKVSTFIGHYTRLEEHCKRAEKLAARPDLWQRWPKAPGTTFSWKGGDSALDVAFQFARMIRGGVLYGHGQVFGIVNTDHFPSDHATDEQFASWRDAAIRELQQTTLPKLPEWPMWQIHRDHAALASKLADEWRRAESTAMETPKTNCADVPNPQTGPTSQGASPAPDANHPTTIEDQGLQQRLAGIFANTLALAERTESSYDDSADAWLHDTVTLRKEIEDELKAIDGIAEKVPLAILAELALLADAFRASRQSCFSIPQVYRLFADADLRGIGDRGWKAVVAAKPENQNLFPRINKVLEKLPKPGFDRVSEPLHGESAVRTTRDPIIGPRTAELLKWIHARGDANAGCEVVELPQQLRDAALLTVSDADGLIEFGRRNHCTVGGGSHATLVIEDGYTFGSITGPQKKPMEESLREAFADNGPAELRLCVRLTAKGRVEVSRLFVHDETPKVQGKPQSTRESKTVKGLADTREGPERKVLLGNETRDKWIYSKCFKGLPYKNIERELEAQASKKGWATLSGASSIRAAANRYAERYGLDPIPKRQRGRPRRKKRAL